ncbi:cytochrome c biogenesis CcdA family protein [Pelobacter propionicus]|uniref:Cytochrome c biogenesis protein, transmembrane region n=1 Tax=Pelobacter propionicus (strain DSM 2379 / NBRC 103807 / OttBd1) TaxID=338966 RepID=A1AKB7_PELPD|nr:cytochrome c biogenesis protein CcdA [Pelobacter propionicus]ABK97787.1 cytochrome c biogenesis protein, transmembrane region [Pelobacter propionicus DSM 2379]
MTFIGNIEQIIAAYPLLALGAVFLAGVISSASPCVLSTIPLVVGFVGGYSDGDRWKAFRYSLMFIIGLSLTFTAFGAAAGVLGTIFGVVGGWWYGVAGAVALVMGGQLMGLYTIRQPVKPDFKPKKGGMYGAFILGLFFGLVSSPCATPVMVVLLTVVAGKGQVLYGITLMFSYAVGHCMLMLAAGTFTGFVEAFFKTRGVLNASAWSRKASGIIISLAGAWLIWQAM